MVPQCQIKKSLARELNSQGYAASSVKVGASLKAQNYSFQSNCKTVEGKQHPDRDAQFKFIAKRVRACGRCGEPAISIDTKKKETLCNLKNAGKLTEARANRCGSKPTTFPIKSWARPFLTAFMTSQQTRRE